MLENFWQVQINTALGAMRWSAPWRPKSMVPSTRATNIIILPGKHSIGVENHSVHFADHMLVEDVLIWAATNAA